MKDSALFEVTAALRAWEIQAVRKRLQSPAFNHRKEPLLLFDYICRCVRAQERPDSAAAEKIVYGKHTAEHKIRHEMSALLAVIRDYLIYQEMDAEPGRREQYWVQIARKRGLEKNFQLAFRDAEKAGEQMGNADLGKYLFDFQLEMEKYEWESRAERTQEFPLDSFTQNLNCWYAGQLLQLSCMAESTAAVRRQTPTNPNWIIQVLDQIPGQPHKNVPAVALYHLGYCMLTQADDADLPKAFLSQLSANLPALPRNEAKGLLMLAINHNIRRINAGDRSALRHVQQFYLLGLEQRLLQDERGTLSKYTYKNVLMTFLALEEWTQAVDFLEQYRSQLPDEEQENIYRYNLAIIRFRQGDYDRALELLRDVSFPDAMYNLESRKMMLKIYYEQQAFDALESLLDNLMTWLRRHGELGYHREMYRNLARYTSRLLRLRPDDLMGRKKLEQKIKDTPLVAERAWLLEKLQSR